MWVCDEKKNEREFMKILWTVVGLINKKEKFTKFASAVRKKQLYLIVQHEYSEYSSYGAPMTAPERTCAPALP